MTVDLGFGRPSGFGCTPTATVYRLDADGGAAIARTYAPGCLLRPDCRYDRHAAGDRDILHINRTLVVIAKRHLLVLLVALVSAACDDTISGPSGTAATTSHHRHDVHPAGRVVRGDVVTWRFDLLFLRPSSPTARQPRRWPQWFSLEGRLRWRHRCGSPSERRLAKAAT